MKIGITGSISSGKSTVTSILSKNKKLIFSADKIVQKLYLSNKFRKKMSKKFKLKNKNVKTEILKNELIHKAKQLIYYNKMMLLYIDIYANGYN